MTDNTHKEATDNNMTSSDNHDIPKNTDESGAYPTIPTIASDSPWMSAYERYGIDATIDMPEDNTSLLDVFERNFSRYGRKEAYVCMGSSLGFKQLDLYSRQIASYLQSLGLTKGDKVGEFTSKNRDCILLFLLTR